ncbi:MAG: ParB/RepB/Spo0J family partition protein [Bacilli bacterium]
MDTENRVLQVPIEDIIPNRFQPRLAFDDAALKELAESIKQHGVIQPLILRRIGDKYEIIAGERRYKASMLAGLTSVPAILSNLTDNESAEVAIVENVQRKDLTAIEEAKSFKALLDKGYMTQDDLAKKMGLSQAAISNKLRLLTLDESVQQAVLNGSISERHARTLLKAKDVETEKTLLSRIINERLTVRQLEDELKKIYGTVVEPDVPLVNTTPDISNILSSSTDIIKKDEPKDIKALLTPSEDILPVTDVSNMFNNPENLPNKFFNFLEDEAANMNVEETPLIFENKKEEVEEIELLDDFLPKDNKKSEVKEPEIIIPVEPPRNDEYIDTVIDTIRGLHLNSENVTVEEINLPHEYQINIKIKKNLDI